MKKIQNAIGDKKPMAGLMQLPSGKTHVAFYKTGGDGNQTLFIGDSNAQQYAPRISKLISSNTGLQRGALFLTAGAVPPIDRVVNEEKPGCLVLMPKVHEVLANNPKIDRVVIAALWHGYFVPKSRYRFENYSMDGTDGQEKALREISMEIHRIVSGGKKATVVLSIPTGDPLDPKRFYGRDFIGVHSAAAGKLSREVFLKTNGKILSRIASVAKANGAEVIDPMDYLCTNGVCIAANEDGPICMDAFHLRPGYVREHVKYLDQTVAP
jgi:hypothetical protein